MISRLAKANSFHAVMKPNSDVDSRPGASSGKTIRRNAWNWLQPSTCAASSSYTGIAFRNPRNVTIVNGSVIMK